MVKMACTTMVRLVVQFFVWLISSSPSFRAAAQPRIDEATLVAVQHQMAQQAAFAQIPDAVKRVRIALNSNGTTSPTYTYLFLLVYRSLP